MSLLFFYQEAVRCPQLLFLEKCEVAQLGNSVDQSAEHGRTRRDLARARYGGHLILLGAPSALGTYTKPKRIQYARARPNFWSAR